MANDPLSDVRNVRRAIANECGGDPEKIFEFYRKHQEESKRSERFQFVDARKETVNAATADEQENVHTRD